MAWLVVCAAPAWSPGGTIRLWPTAVVVGDAVQLDDVCELRGFDAQTERRLARLGLGDAPQPSGSRVIALGWVRTALATAGENLAQITLSGATQCAVSRPAVAQPTPTAGSDKQANHTPEKRTLRDEPAPSSDAAPPLTLRQAVLDHFNVEFARYGGTAEVVFDRTSDQVLDLCGPTYEFKIRRKGQPLGLCALEVDVLAEGRSVQTVPLVVQVTMLRRAAVVRRTINQDATIHPADVDLAALSFTRLDELGMDDLAGVVGQRAKRVIPAGTLIEPNMLESVPLVLRGQLVTLTSSVGSVRVVTTAKAASDGRLGERITVRAVDDKRSEFDALVSGPGAVRLSGEAADAAPRLASGERSR